MLPFELLPKINVDPSLKVIIFRNELVVGFVNVIVTGPTSSAPFAVYRRTTKWPELFRATTIILPFTSWAIFI